MRVAMKSWYALSAIGRDRPGIVADLAELIYECDCNLYYSDDDTISQLLAGWYGAEFAEGDYSGHRRDYYDPNRLKDHGSSPGSRSFA